MDLDNQFEKANEIFKLELLSHYKVPEEKENFERFLSGEPREKSEGVEEWRELLERGIQKGQIFNRVHVLPDVLSDYLRYEIEWGYFYTSKAGENIYLINESEYLDLLPQKFTPTDAFIFDNENVFEMLYEKDGEFRGTRPVEDKLKSEQYIALKRKLLEKSLPFEDYLEKIGYPK